MTTVALVDDHILLRNSLAKIINTFDGYKVLFEADNGQHFIDQLSPKKSPDIVLLDISMPIMNGYETAAWIRTHLPETKILVLSMMDNESSVIRMINLGASGYILKDSKPSILKEAFDSIILKGFYSNDFVSSTMMNYVSGESKAENVPTNAILFSEKERAFIKYACSEMTYKEIAHEMQTSPRNIDVYRDAVFEKLQLKTRVGLVIFALKEGIVKI
jgi:DNA-binding NarL/FixJ family response regulator